MGTSKNDRNHHNSKQQHQRAMKLPVASAKYQRMPIVIQDPNTGMDLDVTKPHPSMTGLGLQVPDAQKMSLYWNFFHIGTKDVQRMHPDGTVHQTQVKSAVCNLCGASIIIDKRGYSSMDKHMRSSLHKALYYATAAKLGVDLEKSSLAVKGGKKSPVIRTIGAPRKSKAPPMIASATATTAAAAAGATIPTAPLASPPPTAKSNRAKEDLSLKCLNAHVQFHVQTLTPLSVFDTPSFDTLRHGIAECAKVGANYDFDARKVSELTTFLAKEGREKLQHRLHDKTIALATDHWTSRRGNTYACLTAHFIDDDFSIQSAVLGLYQYHGATSAERIRIHVQPKCLEWKIPHARFLVSDTAANFQLAGVHVVDCDRQDHVYCMDHVIQLVANLAFNAQPLGQVLGTVDDVYTDDDDDDDMEDDTVPVSSMSVMQKMRRIISFFHKSPPALQALEQCMQQVPQQPGSGGGGGGTIHSLVRDEVTRWWSTLESVERMLQVKTSIQKFFGDHDTEMLKQWATTKPKHGGGPCHYKLPQPLSTDEWSALNQLTILLGPFKTAQKQLSEPDCVTSSIVIPIITNMERNLSAIQDEVYFNESLGELVKEMRAILQGRLGNVKDGFHHHTADEEGQGGVGAQQQRMGLHPAFYKAYALDPRSKKMPCLTEECKTRVWDAILTELVALGETEGGEPQHSETEGVKENQSASATMNGMDTSWMDEYEEDVEELGPPSAMNGLDTVMWTTKVKIELQEYQSAAGLPYRTKDKQRVYDPLQDWWKENTTKYPNVWKLARLYLGFPASSCESGRTLSITALPSPQSSSVADLGDVGDVHFLNQNWDFVFQ